MDFRALLDRINNHVMRRLGASRRHVFAKVERARSQACPPSITSSPNGGLPVSRRIILSYRVQVLLLLCPTRSHPPAGRCPGDRSDDRDIPSRQTRRCASAPICWAALWNGPRTYAELAPALCRVDAGSLPALGASIGPQTVGLITAILASRPHPEQASEQVSGCCAFTATPAP